MDPPRECEHHRHCDCIVVYNWSSLPLICTVVQSLYGGHRASLSYYYAHFLEVLFHIRAFDRGSLKTNA